MRKIIIKAIDEIPWQLSQVMKNPLSWHLSHTAQVWNKVNESCNKNCFQKALSPTSRYIRGTTNGWEDGGLAATGWWLTDKSCYDSDTAEIMLVGTNQKAVGAVEEANDDDVKKVAVH